MSVHLFMCVNRALCLFLKQLMIDLFVGCRSQMQTIITKACKELDIKPIPSKRVGSVMLMRF